VDNLIGLTGYAGSGKDSVAEVLVEEYGYTRIAFADAIKEVLEATNPLVIAGYGLYLQDVLEERDWNWNEIKEIVGVREMLQNLGTAIRNIDPLFWVNAAGLPDDGYSRVVVTDVRLPLEVEAIRRRGGVVYRVVHPGVEAVNQHLTEVGLDGYEFPVIENSGTLDELRDKVRGLMNECTP
jgi:hypothetical protein